VFEKEDTINYGTIISYPEKQSFKQERKFFKQKIQLRYWIILEKESKESLSV